MLKDTKIFSTYYYLGHSQKKTGIFGIPKSFWGACFTKRGEVISDQFEHLKILFWGKNRENGRRAGGGPHSHIFISIYHPKWWFFSEDERRSLGPKMQNRPPIFFVYTKVLWSITILIILIEVMVMKGQEVSQMAFFLQRGRKWPLTKGWCKAAVKDRETGIWYQNVSNFWTENGIKCFGGIVNQLDCQQHAFLPQISCQHQWQCHVSLIAR